MATTGVIEHCDVVEDIAACSLLGEIVFAADALTFEQLEKLLATALSWQLPRRLMRGCSLWFFDLAPVPCSY